jgi:hypothetical protein
MGTQMLGGIFPFGEVERGGKPPTVSLISSLVPPFVTLSDRRQERTPGRVDAAPA